MSSAVAGKVLLMPKGTYDATATYNVLDWVLYNGKPYVAKQTTTGNTPTDTTYWQLLLDFPTEVDNVPTQNSNNLVKSGGVYSALTDKMDAAKAYSTDDTSETIADADYVPFYDTSGTATKKTLWSSIKDAVTAVFTGATTQANGAKGMVPQPLIADKEKFLKGDGSWATPPSPSDMTGATSQLDGTHGLVPAPTTSDVDKFFKGDGSWGTPSVDISGKMNVDGTNATNLNMSELGAGSFGGAVSKSAGASQVVTITKEYASLYFASAAAENAFWSAHVGGSVFYNDSGLKEVVIDGSSVSGTTITITGHLKNDVTDAISKSSATLYAGNYVTSTKSLVSGEGAAALSAPKIVIGDNTSSSGDYPGVVVGNNSVSSARTSCIIGRNNYQAGLDASVFGHDNIAGYANQFVVGSFNSNKSDTLFEVGAGSSNTRSNKFEVYNDGYISLNNGTDKYKFAKSGGKDGYYDTAGTFHYFEPLYYENSVTLSTSQDVTTTFTQSSITANSHIEPWTSVWGIVPKNVVASSGSCTVTFGKVSTAQTITCGIYVK